jgi:hypothetical protein
MNRWKAVAIVESVLLVAASITLLDSHKHDPGRFRLISEGIALDTETGRFCQAFAKPKPISENLIDKAIRENPKKYGSSFDALFDPSISDPKNDPPYCEDIR